MKSFGEFSHDLQRKMFQITPLSGSKAIAKAKAKFDVYPSAYANAWVQQSGTKAYRKMMKHMER